MPKFYSELQEAALENLASDPAGNVAGRIYRNTSTDRVMLDNGTNKRALLRNDAKLVIGNHATAANNIRVHRSAAGVLQLVLGDDVTAEGSYSTTLAALSSKLEAYNNAGKPAAGNAGRLIYVTDLGEVQYDNGVTWLAAGATGGGFGAAGVESLSGNEVLIGGDSKKILLCDSSGGSFDIELPSPVENLVFTIKDVGGEFEDNPVTLTRPGTEEIEGLEADYVLCANYGSWNIVCDGTNYWITE